MEEQRTKIVCTIGPASSAPTMLARMMTAGMDVARLNFSHGTHGEHALYMKHIRAAAKKAGKHLPILQDLQGQKIRVGALPQAGVNLHEGESVVFTTADEPYVQGGPIPVGYRNMHHDVRAGHRILLDDGFLEVKVTRVAGRKITGRVVIGGVLKSKKGINLPDSQVTAEPFTEKDRQDLLFGIQQGVDWVVLSFVSDPEVVQHVRKIANAAARAYDVRAPWIMAKVETKAAVEGIERILEVVDGIMIGRGDLGLEIPMEQVPIVQKDLIERCRRANKPVIVATHMLDSMARNPRATRAEISDVANAVLDHADAVMLSAESASGRYPAATVKAMAQVIREAEKSRFDLVEMPCADGTDGTHALVHAVSTMARQGVIHGAVVTSASAGLARALPMYRPNIPLVVACTDAAEARRMVLYAGMQSIVLDARAGSFLPGLHAAISKQRVFPRRACIAYLWSGTGEMSLTLAKL